MSESESITSRSSSGSAPRSGADELLPELTARANTEREGLPRNYRMRADAHYVDQLEAPAQPVIRMIKTGQIECRDVPPPDGVEALTQSIAMHGVLQPLLVRRQGGRYSIIAGRKRLAAAIAAGLASVPCVLHEVEGAAADALAEAENLRVEDAPSADAVDPVASRSLLEAVAADLTTIRTSISLLRVGRGGALSQKVGADLVDSQVARAAWLIEATLHTSEDDRFAPLGAIVYQLADAFRSHVSLIGLQLECSVSASAAVWRVPEHPVSAAITGAVFATLSFLEGASHPKIEVHAEAAHGRTLKIEVVQRAVRVPPGVGSDLPSRSGSDMIPALALRLARTVAAAHGGTAELTTLPGAGSVLQMTFVNAQVAG